MEHALTQVMQQLLGSVLGGLEVEQLLVLIDELGVHGGVEELVVGQDVLQEGDVGLDAQRKREGERGSIKAAIKAAVETTGARIENKLEFIFFNLRQIVVVVL